MIHMNKKKIKTLGVDLLADVVGSLLVAVGIYNFAVASEFPVTGVTGIALVFYHYLRWPIGLVTLAINVPIIIGCGKVLGLKFLLKSLKTMFIYTIILDTVAPLLPVYRGDMILSCICMGLFAGIGYAIIYMRGTSTGGVDFITMTIRAKNPHLSLGKIILGIDCSVLLVTGLLMRGEVDKIIYGLLAASIVSVVVDKVMYGLNAGKVAFVVTGEGKKVADKIYELTGRGATLLEGMGSYTRNQKHIVMCACSYKQMHMVQKAVKEVDREAFLVTMEANEVRGQGFKPH